MRILVFPARTKPAKAMLVCLHGIQTHATWFSLTAPTFQKHGISVLCPDRRGSGEQRDPSRPVADIDEAQRWLDDLAPVFAMARKEQPSVFILGTSWGAKPALAYAAAHPKEIAGVALLVPALKTHQETFWRKIVVFFGNVFSPRAAMTLPLAPALYLPAGNQTSTTNGRNLEREIASDPWLLRQATYRFMFQANKLQTNALRQWTAPALRRVPVIAIFSGESDQIVKRTQSEKLLAVMRDLETEVWEGEGHGIQVQHPQPAAERIADWIARVRSRSP